MSRGGRTTSGGRERGDECRDSEDELDDAAEGEGERREAVDGAISVAAGASDWVETEVDDMECVC